MADDGDKKKKERVLHTRISEALDQELRSKAAELGMSVSKLVRNVLVNTVDLVETVVSDSAQVADRARMVGESFQPRDPSMVQPGQPPSEILAWQRVTLNLNALCESCNGILPKGTEACLALSAGGVTGVFRCLSCVDSGQETNLNDEGEVDEHGDG